MSTGKSPAGPGSAILCRDDELAHGRRSPADDLHAVHPRLRDAAEGLDDTVALAHGERPERLRRPGVLNLTGHRRRNLRAADEHRPILARGDDVRQLEADVRAALAVTGPALLDDVGGERRALERLGEVAV